MEVGLELRPVGILATDDEPVPDAFLEVRPQALGNCLEVLERFLGHSTLRMSPFVTVETVAGSVAREHVDNSSAFPQIVQAKIENAGALPVNHGHAQRRLRPQQSRQRFQLKARLKIDLRASKLRRQ